MQRDSINYFPPNAHQACALVFFPDLTSRALPRDDVDLSDQRACVGRLFFKIPGGITYGQYWLNVKFAKSVVRVPFRILTEDEEKFLSKNYKAIDKQVEDAFKKEELRAADRALHDDAGLKGAPAWPHRVTPRCTKSTPGSG